MISTSVYFLSQSETKVLRELLNLKLVLNFLIEQKKKDRTVDYFFTFLLNAHFEGPNLIDLN